MRAVNKVAIADIKKALQAIEYYDKPDHTFKELWDSWRYWCIRHRIHNTQFFRVKWKDGWLKKNEAAELCDYLIKDWHPKILDI